MTETYTQSMGRRERLITATILLIILAMVVLDLITDSREGVELWHVMTEAAIGLAAIVGIFIILRESVALKFRLANERKEFSHYRVEAEKWRVNSQKYLVGLSEAIDTQLRNWKLTEAEKEVAFLLLKGLSLKEIATVRQTSEKTTRVQATAIYTKSGLAGRSELAAFFLEDLVVPSRRQGTDT